MARTASSDPSVEQLSITHTSALPVAASGSIDSRHRSRSSRVLKETTATVTLRSRLATTRQYGETMRVRALGNVYSTHHLGGYEISRKALTY